jgi:hypothetical protein
MLKYGSLDRILHVRYYNVIIIDYCCWASIFQCELPSYIGVYHVGVQTSLHECCSQNQSVRTCVKQVS